ncbi:hypothetical protein AVEN_101429-1 [Araneus ventricosus]|uniref:Uncharacterized protein n=1 Tax=Araneus ventricosus TaxID=182803 RepID=A0A4Y2CX52_ARAVE|nr:hypothetical protein AVEN_101429-1 [Araneus ventricosus]
MVNQLKRDATYEEKADLHYSIGWEWYHPSCSTDFKWNSQNAENPRHFAKLIMKFKRTFSNASRSGRPKTSTDAGTLTLVLASMVGNPTKSSLPLSAQM